MGETQWGLKEINMTFVGFNEARRRFNTAWEGVSEAWRRFNGAWMGVSEYLACIRPHVEHLIPSESFY